MKRYIFVRLLKAFYNLLSESEQFSQYVFICNAENLITCKKALRLLNSIRNKKKKLVKKKNGKIREEDQAPFQHQHQWFEVFLCSKSERKERKKNIY